MTRRILFVHPEVEARSRVKQIGAMLKSWATFEQMTDLAAAQAHLQTSDPYDAIFLSASFGRETLTRFIRTTRGFASASGSCFVALLGHGAHDVTMVGSHLLSGFEGFLIEPFSVDTVVEVVEVAERVRREETQRRQAYALELLVHSVLEQAAEVYQLRRAGRSAKLSAKLLQETATVLRQLEPSLEERYFCLLTSALENSSCSAKSSWETRTSGAFKAPPRQAIAA